MSFVIGIAMMGSSFAAKPVRITVDEARKKHLLVNFVRPDYPEIAKRNFWTGRGVFELTFDHESGLVREVHVVHSTGHGILDAYVIAALKRWRVTPRSIRTLAPFPIEFTYTGR
jgi:TonB family protein